MCFICGLLDKSFPSPKQLANALRESDTPSDHDELYRKLKENPKFTDEYEEELFQEFIKLTE